MKHSNLSIFLKGIVMIQIFILIIIAGVSTELNNYFDDFVKTNAKNLFVPFTSFSISNANAENLVKESNMLMAGNTVNSPYTGVFYKNRIPQNLITSNFPVMAYSNIQPDADHYKEPPKIEPVDGAIKPPVNGQGKYAGIFQGYKVVFYCTHSAESYIPDSGKPKLEGQKGLINDVALNISKNLNQKGLKADFIDRIHDYPEYNKSYTNSRLTVKETLENTDETILALFDIHRDSIPGSTNANTVKINGQQAATILIIVGTDERKTHLDWKENLEFAEKLHQKADAIYPGLIKGIRTKAGTYNQEFHDSALLLEFGTDYNSFEQANYAGKLFADILLEVLKEEVE